MRDERRWEKLNVRLEKTNCDLKFLLQRKQENVIPRFAKPKLSIYASYKIKKKIVRPIIEAEISNKHEEKKNVKDQLKQLSSKLKGNLGDIAYHSLKYRVRSVTQMKKKIWQSTHKKKMENIKSKRRENNIITNINDFAKMSFRSFLLRHFQKKKLKHCHMELITTSP